MSHLFPGWKCVHKALPLTSRRWLLGGVVTSYVITRREGGALKGAGKGRGRAGRGGATRGWAGPETGRGHVCNLAGARGGGRVHLTLLPKSVPRPTGSDQGQPRSREEAGDTGVAAGAGAPQAGSTQDWGSPGSSTAAPPLPKGPR